MNPLNLMGRRSIDLLPYLAESLPSVARFVLVKYQEPLALQDRQPLADNCLLDRALAERTSTKRPFWDCVLANLDTNSLQEGLLIQEALFHNDTSIQEVSYDAGEVDNREMRKLTSGKYDGVVALASKVQNRDSSVQHVPMLDFHCESSNENIKLVYSVMDKLTEAEYFVASSGKSYHVFVVELLSDEGWREFLYRSLLLSPIIDTRYVAHQLLAGRCALRLVATPRKRMEPRIVGHRARRYDGVADIT